jgi:hypothetical protein
MTDSGSRSQVRPPESFTRSRFGLLAIASLITRYYKARPDCKVRLFLAMS